MAQAWNLSFEAGSSNEQANILSIRRINNVDIKAEYKRNGVVMTFFEWSVDTTIQRSGSGTSPTNGYDFGYEGVSGQSLNVGWGDGTRERATIGFSGNFVVAQHDYAVGGVYNKLRVITDGNGHLIGENRNFGNDGPKGGIISFPTALSSLGPLMTSPNGSFSHGNPLLLLLCFRTCSL